MTHLISQKAGMLAEFSRFRAGFAHAATAHILIGMQDQANEVPI